MKSLVVLILLFTACQNDVKKNIIIQKSTLESSPYQGDDSKDDFDLVFDYLDSEYVHMGFARILVGSISNNKKMELLRKSLQNMPIDDIKNNFKKLNNDRTILRREFLSQGNRFNFQTYIFDKSKTNKMNDSYIDRQIYKTINYIQSKELENILSSYDKRLNHLSDELLPFLISDIVNSNTNQQEIEDNIAKKNYRVAIKKIESHIQNMAIVSQAFANSTLSESDKVFLLGSTALASIIVDKLKEEKKFKLLLNKYRWAQSQVEDAKNKINEFILLAGAVDKGLSDITSGLTNFNHHLGKTRVSTQNLMNIARSSETNDFNARRILSFLHQQFRQGHNNIELTEPFSEYASDIKENLNLSFQSIYQATNGLENILITTRKVSNLLGIKFSKGFEKTLQDAQKVTRFIQVGKTVLDAFTTGGATTALNVLSGSSILSGNSNDYQLKKINKKLNTILKNQKVILETQIETMKMVKDLALMLDEYHYQQMRLLSELRDYNLSTLELLRIELIKNKTLPCSEMINQKKHQVFGIYTDSIPDFSLDSLDFYKDQLFSSSEGIVDIQKFLFRGDKDLLKDCKKGIREVFSFNQGTSLLFEIFNSNNETNESLYEKIIYRPSLDLYRHFYPKDSYPLHFPFDSLMDLDKKHANSNHNRVIDQAYYLDRLISPTSLEHFTKYLAFLYPFFDIDTDIWKDELAVIINRFKQDSQEEYVSQGLDSLINALKFVQSSIAQQSLIAGEPLLSKIYDDQKMHKFLLANLSCQEAGIVDQNLCLILDKIKSNRLLMSNYINFVLNKHFNRRSNNSQSYIDMFDHQDIAGLNSALGKDINFVVDEKDIFLNISFSDGFKTQSYRLIMPNPKTVSKAKVEYNSQLQRLLVIQNIILNELEISFPYKRQLGEDISRIVISQ